MKRTFKILLLLIVVVVPVMLVWVRHVRDASFDEAAYRNTSSLAIEDVVLDLGVSRCVVAGTLVNHDSRGASSVILLVQLIDETGRVLVSNPMVEVLGVPANGSKAFEALLPAKSVPSGVVVSVKALVVCWEEGK